MAKFTGTIGNPSVDASGNKIVKPIGEPIDIVFYAKGKAPIIRTTSANGKYDFTLVNGSYQVSMYISALPEAFRIRADLRDGEFFVVATNSPTGAFQEWIDTAVDANKPEDNPIIKHIQGQLDAMQAILDQFRDETSFVGGGKIMREQAYGLGTSPTSSQIIDMQEIRGMIFTINANEREIESLIVKSDFDGRRAGIAVFGNTTYRYGYAMSRITKDVLFFNSTTGGAMSAVKLITDHNSVTDTNGFLKAASPIIKLFNDRIETNYLFKEDPVFEKIGVGTYKISNTLGLAKEGWTYEKPRGSDGNPYFRIVVEKTDDGCIITVHDEYVDYEDKEIIDSEGSKRTVKERVTVLSAARDIKDHERWIDLRFHEEPKEEAEILAEMEAEHKEE